MEKQALTVTELTRTIKQLLELNFGQVCVLGEISNLARPGSGHLYFNIKDENSQLRSVMFRSAAQRCRFELENGLEVFLFGRITVYEPRGDYQIIVDAVEPFGAGALQLAFEQLKARLELEGLFEASEKKAIPYLPSKIGVVTSPTGAAIRDILNILERRFASIPVIVNPVSVQGESAAAEIARAIEQFNEMAEIDVMIVGRGGGSIEDLWSFNEEIVARAIFASEIPIVSAVGHERDFTIADYVADLRAPTPSAAAELVVPLKSDLEHKLEELDFSLVDEMRSRIERLKEKATYLSKRLRSPETIVQTFMMKIDELNNRLNQALKSNIGDLSNHLNSLQQKLFFYSPKTLVEKKQAQIQELSLRLTNEIQKTLETKRNRFAELAHVLESLSPLSTMSRGYSLVSQASGRLVTSIQQVKQNSRLKIRLSDGTLDSIVEHINPEEPTTTEE